MHWRQRFLMFFVVFLSFVEHGAAVIELCNKEKVTVAVKRLQTIERLYQVDVTN